MSGVGALSRFIGPRYKQIAQSWIPSGALFGGSATLLLLYFTDWKAVLEYVPIYNQKYKEDTK